MAIYDANTGQLIESPDFSAGYLVDGTIIIGYITEVFPNTVTDARPDGIKHRVPVTELCQWYFLNPEEPETPATDTFEGRLAAVEEGVAEAKEGLTAAKIMLGVE